ncbi:hypothetical protein CFO_g4080 [Ceratocystis platani]|uniref:Uncharacterized protein n=1 Tax=Ceratocystis fimbriata f. sp. platani TaxID=88771 RepID=A0A0F8BMB1_CERFI|nr:hypothetical protein CFO_g4080 [Ceratocystis platani]
MTGPPPEKVDPLVYVCGAGQVCYKNNYEGGYSQFGCGTPGSQPATVLVNVAGQPPVDIQQVNIKANPTSDGGAGSEQVSRACCYSQTIVVFFILVVFVVLVIQLLGPFDYSYSGYPISRGVARITDFQDYHHLVYYSRGGLWNGFWSDCSTLSGIAAFLALGAVGFYYYRKKQRTQPPAAPPNEKSMSSPTSSHGSFMTSSSQADNSPTSMTEPMFLVTHDFPLPPVGAAVSSNHKQDYGHDGGYPLDVKTDFDHLNNTQPTVITTATATAGGPGAKSAKDNTMSYASSTYSRYLQPGALPSPTSPYSDSGLDLAREVDDFQNSYIAALGDIREESESSYSRNSVPPVPPMPQKPDSAWV